MTSGLPLSAVAQLFLGTKVDVQLSIAEGYVDHMLRAGALVTDNPLYESVKRIAVERDRLLPVGDDTFWTNQNALQALLAKEQPARDDLLDVDELACSIRTSMIDAAYWLGLSVAWRLAQQIGGGR